MAETAPLKVYGLSEQHKEFLYSYAEKELGARSMTRAIVALINEKMQPSVVESEPEKFTPPPFNSSQSKTKKRVQISLNEHDYYLLDDIAKNTDTSIPYYIIRLILNNIYSQSIKLLGVEIEQLRKSNYEIHKIGVNLNQIARNINTGELNIDNLNALELFNELDKNIQEHIHQIQVILESSLSKY